MLPGAQEVVAAVEAKLQAAAQALELPPWPSAATQACHHAADLLARRFGKAARLLASLAAFEGTLARSTLASLALSSVLPQVGGHPAPRAARCLWLLLLLLLVARMRGQAAVGQETCLLSRREPSSRVGSRGLRRF